MSFVTGHDIHLIALDNFLQDRLRLARNHTLSQLPGHSVHVIFVAIQLLGDL